ncbi:hypothetical protein, partial [Streptococcus suis]|uniref:hypothetical protein n=1 Tax=Streptococcus suis TaxID=1307 RepID=UPI002AAB6BAE
QESRNRKKNTDSSAGFHLKQLNLSVYFFSYWLVFAQPLFKFLSKNSCNAQYNLIECSSAVKLRL